MKAFIKSLFQAVHHFLPANCLKLPSCCQYVCTSDSIVDPEFTLKCSPTGRYAMEAVSKLELSGVMYPPCPLPTYGTALPQSAAAGGGANAAAMAPGAAANPAMLAAMQQACAGLCHCSAIVGHLSVREDMFNLMPTTA